MCEPLTVFCSENKFAVSFASVKMTLWTHHWWQSAKVARILVLDSQNKRRCAGRESHAIPAQYYAMAAPSGLLTSSKAIKRLDTNYLVSFSLFRAYVYTEKIAWFSLILQRSITIRTSAA